MSRSITLLTLLLAACAGSNSNGDKTDDTGTTPGDDTGGTTGYDTGCITVDGQGGYAHINDAIAAAQPGSEISVCAGTYEEAVVVDKAVSLVGIAGTVISGPANEVALTIGVDAAGASVSGIEIESTRTGISIEGASDVSLNGITVGETGSWGLSASDATNLAIADSSFAGSQGGGVEITGGDATISGTSFTGTVGLGVSILDGATVTLSGNSFGEIVLSDDTSFIPAAVSVSGATLNTEANTFMGADPSAGVAAINGEDSAVMSLSGDTIVDFGYGVLAQPATLDADGLSITGCFYQGIFALDEASHLAVSNTTVSMPPGESCSYDYADWGDAYVCGGILFAGVDESFENVQVSGYEDYGIAALAYTDDGTALTMNDVTVSEAGRWGINVGAATGSLTGVTITGNREPEMAQACRDDTYIYINQSVGLLLGDSDVSIADSSFTGNDAWGLSNNSSRVSITGSTFDGNTCAGILSYQGVLDVSGSTFSESSGDGGIWDYQGVSVISGNTFTNNHQVTTTRYEYYNDGTHSYEYEYTSDASVDIQASESASLTITDNTFTDGNRSLNIFSSGATVTGNTWTDYDDGIVYVQQSEEEDPLVFTDNSVDDVAGSVIYDVYGYADVENVTVGTARSTEVTYTYYTDGEVSSVSTGESYGPTFEAVGYTGYPAGITISGVDVVAPYYMLADISDATAAIYDLTSGPIGADIGYGYGIYGTWDYSAPEIEVDGLSIESSAGYGFYLNNSSPDVGYVSIANADVGSTSTGFSQSGLPAFTLADSTFGPASYQGLVSEAVVNVYDSSLGAYTAQDFATAAELSNVTFASGSSGGLSFEGGSLTADGVILGGTMADGSTGTFGGDGISLGGLTSASLSNVQVSGTSGDGIAIDDTFSFYRYSDYTYEDHDGDTVSTLSDVTVTGAGGYGVSIMGGSATLTRVTATTSGSGLWLDSTSASVMNNTFTGNTSYGMECMAVTLSMCMTNDLTGNGLGEHNGCDDACGM